VSNFEEFDEPESDSESFNASSSPVPLDLYDYVMFDRAHLIRAPRSVIVSRALATRLGAPHAEAVPSITMELLVPRRLLSTTVFGGHICRLGEDALKE
jgi:hypothetical protein